jgi:hypothetical protein
MSDDYCDRHDFQFGVSFITSTSFSLHSSIAGTFTINYTKIIVDYIASSSTDLYTGLDFYQIEYLPIDSPTYVSIIYNNENLDNTDTNNIFHFFIIG